MLPDRVSNPGPLTYESGALPIALRGPQMFKLNTIAIAWQCHANEHFLVFIAECAF